MIPERCGNAAICNLGPASRKHISVTCYYHYYCNGASLTFSFIYPFGGLLSHSGTWGGGFQKINVHPDGLSLQYHFIRPL